MCPTLAHTNPVLLVDDDIEAAQRWAEGLRSCPSNYTVLTANTMPSALDLYRNQKMACVVLDLDMGTESGFVVLNELVPDRHHREIPVVVLTRLLSTTVHSFALEYGAHACFVKSRTSPETLCGAVDAAIASLAVPLHRETTLRSLLSVHADFHQLFEALGVSMRETGIVLSLHRHPGANVQYIADRLGVVIPYVERIVEKLIEQQIVRSDADETGMTIWFLTRKGVRLAVELEQLTFDLSRQINQVSNPDPNRPDR